MDTSLFSGAAVPVCAALFAAAPSLISRFVFWPYCAGVAYSAIGIWVARAEVAKARGLEKIVALGSLCYAVPLAVFGAEHLARPLVLRNLVPVWMPWRLFWAYFVGVALFAAALSILLKRYVRLSATLLGTMFLLFVLMMDRPGSPAIDFRGLLCFGNSRFPAGLSRWRECRRKNGGRAASICSLRWRGFLSGFRRFFTAWKTCCIPGWLLACR